jgi:PKD repeat protein
LRRPAKVVVLMAAVLSSLLTLPFTGAQPVGNPGSLNFKIVGGSVKVGLQQFSLEPKDTTECNDGENNDGDPQNPEDAQDLLIDFPADPQCTSLLDNSEVAPGFQPKQDTTISGTVNAAGVVSVPQSGIFFPPIYVWAQGSVLTVQIQPTSAGSGTINPLTGAATLNISLRISIQGSAQGVDLGSNCGIGPFTLAMTTGTTNPPLPNEPISGVPYDEETGRATVVNNSFSVPGATNCGPLGAANGPLNAALGVPSPSGTNTAILVVEANPKILKGVRASNVPSTETGVAPLIVNFNGTGSTAVKPITAYEWDFTSDGTVDATGPTASFTYTTPGVYQAKLTVVDSDGDRDSQIRTITVNEPPNVPPTAAIAASGSGGQAPYTLQVDGSGSSDPDGSITSYAWDFGNGRTATGPTASVTYTGPGTFTVTLTVTDNRGATGTATRVITVTGAPNAPPTAVIRTVSVSGTIPLTVNLSGANSTDPDGSIVSYAWNLGNGQTATGPAVQVIYTEAGSYTVTLTVTDDRGATNTQSLVIEVSEDSNIAPSAEIVADPISGTAPLQVTFDGTESSDVDGTIVSYAWNFGNGQNALGPTPPPVTYNLPGTYTATLTVTDNRGATGVVSQTITVNRPPNQSPTANLTATPTTGSAPLLVQFSSTGSTDPDGAVTGYLWNFGNGTTSTSPNPSATYTTAGTYTVVLTITDNDGASAVRSTTIVVNPANQPPVPLIQATPLTGPAPLQVSVNGAGSVDPDGSIVSYSWNFGNGQTATGPLAQTTYTSPGTYTLRLTVTDNRNATRSTTVTIVAGATNVRPNAVLTALPTSGPAPLAVQLSSAGSNDPDGSITSYAWDFGDGRTATGPTATVTYPTAGTYTVRLTVTDNRGGTGTTTEQIVVDPPSTPRDRVRLQFTGSVNYGFDGPITSGNLTVVTDFFGPQAVTGFGNYGAGGTVTVNLSRFLWFNAFVGNVTVNDPANGLVNQSSTVFFGALSRPSATSVRGTASGFNASLQPYTLSFTIDDRA